MVTGQIVDMLSNILSVRLFATKKSQKQLLEPKLEAAVAAEQKLNWMDFIAGLIYCYSFVALQLVNFYYLCKGRQEGWLSVGDFALVIGINVAIIDFLWNMAQEFEQLPSHMAGHSRHCGRY